MKEITSKELKQIQLGILDSIHTFCEKNGIRYFLSSGTLIGAVRHKGYIPWDDDIDVYIPRKDYNKFVKLFPENSPENMELRALETSKTYQYLFAKVIDSRTELIETYFGEKFRIGVYVDVFPLENVPTKTLRFILWIFFLQFLRTCLSLTSVAQARGKKWISEGRNTTKKVIKFFLFPILKLISFRVFLLLHNKVAQCVSSHTKYVYNASCGIGPHGCFRRSAIKESVDIEFEGKFYKTMSGYKEYLYVTYGDFMQLPPIEERKSYHLFSAIWK